MDDDMHPQDSIINSNQIVKNWEAWSAEVVRVDQRGRSDSANSKLDSFVPAARYIENPDKEKDLIVVYNT